MNEEWREFFEDKSSWKGPTYNLTMILRDSASRRDLERALTNDLGLEILKGTIERGIKYSIFTFGPDQQPIGVGHTYMKEENMLCSMQLSFYPAQMKRIIDTPEKSKQLHQALIELIRKVGRKFPVMCATICDESFSFVFPPDIAGRSICFEKSAFEKSGVDKPKTELKDPWQGYYAIAMDS